MDQKSLLVFGGLQIVVLIALFVAVSWFVRGTNRQLEEKVKRQVEGYGEHALLGPLRSSFWEAGTGDGHRGSCILLVTDRHVYYYVLGSKELRDIRMDRVADAETGGDGRLVIREQGGKECSFAVKNPRVWLQAMGRTTA